MDSHVARGISQLQVREHAQNELANTAVELLPITEVVLYEHRPVVRSAAPSGGQSRCPAPTPPAQQPMSCRIDGVWSPQFSGLHRIALGSGHEVHTKDTGNGEVKVLIEAARAEQINDFLVVVRQRRAEGGLGCRPVDNRPASLVPSRRRCAASRRTRHPLGTRWPPGPHD